MNLHKKIGGIPLPVILGVIAGGLVLGIYLRHRAKGATSTTTTDPVGTYSTAAGGGGIADPSSGLNGDLIALLQQQGDALTAALLTLGGGGGAPPAAPAPAAPAPSAPTVSVASSGGSGASPNAGAAPPAISDPTFAAPSPITQQTLVLTSGGIPLGSFTAPVHPISEPASTYYTDAGLKPSDPYTILPASAFATSTGPAAQLADTIKMPPRQGGAIAV